MSIETAIKFCNLCHVYSSRLGFGNGNYDWSSSDRLESCLDDKYVIIMGRDDCTHKAMTALEDSLTKNREPTPMEEDPKNDIQKVKEALTACLKCDYKQPSIVDIFVGKKIQSQDDSKERAMTDAQTFYGA